MQRIEKIGKFTITHNIPDLTPEEREDRQKEILLKLYNCSNEENGGNKKC